MHPGQSTPRPGARMVMVWGSGAPILPSRIPGAGGQGAWSPPINRVQTGLPVSSASGLNLAPPVRNEVSRVEGNAP